jgi:hypothetical protein
MGRRSKIQRTAEEKYLIVMTSKAKTGVNSEKQVLRCAQDDKQLGSFEGKSPGSPKTGGPGAPHAWVSERQGSAEG